MEAILKSQAEQLATNCRNKGVITHEDLHGLMRTHMRPHSIAHAQHRIGLHSDPNGAYQPKNPLSGNQHAATDATDPTRPANRPPEPPQRTFE